ncbi:helix-turn-helix domain-containing protein [Paenibacillus sp. 2TAB23]|uniref:response regulator transcription factor n=1 Tax=Paenibacillus sp. 2TAB23 TaxID=3233004 RepID=UPI003F97F71C
MYKVMVVDDEPWGRKAIGKMISELAPRLEVIAEARHGEEALALIRISKPHIVVTDMNMPVMNGQEFLARLHREYNEIKVIVISGYSEFEYLKAALTYRACEYVLKPVSAADLREAMAKAIEAIQNESSLLEQKKHAEDVQSLKREAFLQHIASGRIHNVADIYEQAERLGVPYAQDRFCVALVSLRQYRPIADIKFHGNADLLMFSVENVWHELLSADSPLVFKTDNRERIVLAFPESAYDRAQIMSLLDRFQAAMKRMYAADVLVGLCKIGAKLEQLPAAFESAHGALLANGFHAAGLCICEQEASRIDAAGGLFNTFEAKAFNQALASRSGKDMKRIVESLANKIKQLPDITIREVHRELTLLAELLSVSSSAALTRPAFLEPKAIAHILDGNELGSWLASTALFIDSLALSQEKSETDQSIRDIAVFLDEHYFEDLSLVDVATRFHIDPSYLSKLFKSVTGENFIEYISRKRIEKACELLSGSDRKIVEIAELTGYENQRYFSQVFKKMKGQTPSEYREASLDQESPV